ncbi:MAG TPA: phosphoenolpyruvate--protein phosphotransferase [Accumulibacter sp.]|uniref:phosphoenolpyruvate--protein phosphotransferase n=1 Tax=Accumulibacter sp. TaxID=2053492 RepID=UPI002BE50C92|nr:phosphoenolpyruvate--protein phosphotransferase [Accumulibacter sp.]HRF73226.1 phosphoenolpyruvate--protein phosphotransferase [Accumulibacter sp.]
MNIADNAPPAPLMILGEVASSGLARGRALLCDCARRQTAVPRREVNEEEAQGEVERFDTAVAVAEEKLLEVQERLRRTLGNDEAEIFEAQILLLRDVHLRDAVRALCLDGRMNVEAAVEEAIRELMALFGRLEDPYFRERAADLHDVGKRLLDHLAENGPADLPVLHDGCVIVTHELLASVVAQLEGHGVRGLIVEKGGLTAHATILARSLGIPMLVQVPDATRKIGAGDLVIVDALAGRVFVNPQPGILRKYDQLEANLKAHQGVLKGLIGLPTVTQDGVEIRLCANIGQTADALAAANVKADGVGLYRTEFVFLVQDHFPAEDEQYQFYRATAEHLRPSETVIRLLDVGSDKPLSYFPLPREANPAMGCRGTRLLLAHPALLNTQLRAILRLSASHPVAILLPMIDGIDELRAAKAAIESAKKELAEAGPSFDPCIPIGAMIETPSAAILVGQLADEVDFLSVGTNDLVQFLLAADRIRGEMASTYDPLHPAVIQVLATLASVARSKGKPISLCGEIASDPAYTNLLIGLGFRSFSVAAGRLLEIKHAIRSTSLQDAERLAGQVLPLSSTRDIRARVQDDWNRRRPVSSPELDPAPSATSTTPLPVTHNAVLQRFESQAGNSGLAFLSYLVEGDRVILNRTFVPDERRGHGLAAELVRVALDEARQRRWKIVPRCSYVARFIDRHPQFSDLVSQQERELE